MKQFSDLLREDDGTYRHFERVADEVNALIKAGDNLRYNGKVKLSNQQHAQITNLVKQIAIQHILDGKQSAPDKDSYSQYMSGFLGHSNSFGNKIGASSSEVSKVMQKLQEASTPTLQKGRFWIEGMKSPEVGYYNPTYRWNGFYAPAFEEATVIKILKSLKGISYDIKDGVLWIKDGMDDEFESQIETLKTVDGDKELYYIGDSWTWVKK